MSGFCTSGALGPPPSPGPPAGGSGAGGFWSRSGNCVGRSDGFTAGTFVPGAKAAQDFSPAARVIGYDARSSMADPATLQWWLRKAADGTEFGPVPFAQLLAWAEAAQLSPLDRVSADGSQWMRVPMLAELQMDWLVAVGPGHLYGPTTLSAVREFYHDGEITADTELINACDGESQTVGSLVEPPAALEEAPAPSRSGLRENLQQRIRELEHLLMDARREAAMWRERHDRAVAAASRAEVPLAEPAEDRG